MAIRPELGVQPMRQLGDDVLDAGELDRLDDLASVSAPAGRSGRCSRRSCRAASPHPGGHSRYGARASPGPKGRCRAIEDDRAAAQRPGADEDAAERGFAGPARADHADDGTASTVKDTSLMTMVSRPSGVAAMRETTRGPAGAGAGRGVSGAPPRAATGRCGRRRSRRSRSAASHARPSRPDGASAWRGCGGEHDAGADLRARTSMTPTHIIRGM